MSKRRSVNVAKVALDWLKGLGVLTLTLLGIILYICVAAPATIFYTRLGTTPDEVGITYIGLLSGSLLGIILMIIALAVVFAICSSFVRLRGEDVKDSIRRRRMAILIFCIVVILVFPSVLAFLQAGEVKKGSEQFLGSQFGIFGYHARPVSLGSTSSDVKQIINTSVNNCNHRIFLLGQNSQYVILYVSVDHRTVRVPTSLVIVKSPPSDQLGCS
jgi:hypothetical protein